jgi:hypothetical protein
MLNCLMPPGIVNDYSESLNLQTIPNIHTNLSCFDHFRTARERCLIALRGAL